VLVLVVTNQIVVVVVVVVAVAVAVAAIIVVASHICNLDALTLHNTRRALTGVHQLCQGISVKF